MPMTYSSGGKRLDTGKMGGPACEFVCAVGQCLVGKWDSGLLNPFSFGGNRSVARMYLWCCLHFLLDEKLH